MKCSNCGAECNGKFCPSCGTSINTGSTTTKAPILFGFRSNRLWKKVLSILYFAFCAIILLGTLLSWETGKITTYDRFIGFVQDIVLLLILFSPYIFLSNTKFRDKLPLFKNHKRSSSLIGMIIILTLLFALFSAVDSLHSAEYLADMENHAYVQTETTPASCEEAGAISYQCEYCGSTKTDTIPATGHDMIEASRQDATESSNGQIITACKVCGKEEVTAIDKLPDETEASSEPTTNSTESPTLATEEATTPTQSTNDTALSEKEKYIAACNEITYKDLARQPEKYKGKQLCFKGEVAQVSEPLFGKSITYLIQVTCGEYGFWDDTVYVTYTLPDGAPKILEDDIVMLYGECDGDYSYTSVLGARITVPYIKAKYIDIVE